MLTPRQRRKSGLAAIVTVGGVLAIWTFATLRQQEQTERLSRAWVGEQWDVARQCLLGTPIGRGEGEPAIAAALEARLYRTLMEASEAELLPDPDAIWPARCVPALASLHVDRAILRGDPGDAVQTIEVLAPRVVRVGPDGPSSLSVGEAAERARELAGAIAVLDEVMPYGAEYPADAFPAETIDPAAVRASMQRAGAVMGRPFLVGAPGGGALVDELHGDVGYRITQEESGYARSISGGSRAGVEALATDGRPARFVARDGRAAWLDPDGRHLRLEGGADPIPVDGVEGAITDFATCLSGERRFLALAVGERVWLARWPELAAPPERAIAVRPRPPSTRTRFFCGEVGAAFVWIEDERWIGALCGRDACRPLPPLRAGADLQLALAPGGEVLALGRGRRTDLPIARTLRGDAWSEPFVALRGTPRADGERFVVETADGEARPLR